MNNGDKYYRRKAKWPCACIKCNGQIVQGHYFTWDRTTKGKTWHYDCQSPFSRPSDDSAVGTHEPLESEPRHETETTPVVDATPVEPTPVVDASTSTNGSVPTPATSNSSDPLAAFANALIPYIDGKVKSQASELSKTVIDDVTRIVNETLAKIEARFTSRVELVLPTGEMKTLDGVHEKFATLLKLISIREWAYLYGPSGSFKSTSAHQAADACGLQFEPISLNAQTFESRLFGFIDASGTYKETGFRRCYENGGVFLIDEIDNASGNLLTSLNQALANGCYGFPDKVVKRHDDFVCIVTGNTAGRGASRNHAERRALDAATLDRFKHVSWNYDWKLVRSATLAINPNADKWVDWVIAAHSYCSKEYPQVLCTPRACFGAAKLMTMGFSDREIADMCVFKGLDDDSCKRILNAVPLR